MRRREFIALAGGLAAAWPLAAAAQQPERLRRVGILATLPETDPVGQARLAIFRQRLQELGWIEGRNVHFEYRRAASDADGTRASAAELIRMAPDVVLAANTHVVSALRQETNSVPIVFVHITDPIGSAFVASLARPGGNMTGFTNYEATLGGKWVQILKEIVPAVAHVIVIFNPETAPYAGGFIKSVEAVASDLGMQVHARPVHNRAEIENSIQPIELSRTGLLALPDVSNATHRELIVGLAARHRLPAIYPRRFFVTAGGLVSYGNDEGAETTDVYAKAASYVDRILRGANPGELSVQGPTKFALIINLKAAKALGIGIPPTLLARADEVIE